MSPDRADNEKPGDDTQDHELGEDFLSDDEDREDEELDPEAYDEDEDDEVEERDYDDELDEIVAAETVEWSPEDAESEEGESEEAQSEEGEGEEGEDEEREDEEPEEELDRAEVEEPTMVAATDGAPSTDAGGRPGRLRWALGVPFRWMRFRLPLWARFLVASFLIVSSMAAATAISGLLFLSAFAEDLRHGGALRNLQDKLASVEGGEPQTIMIIGSDLQPIGSSKKFQGLSDTTMLLRLDPDREAIALFSLPRDLKVEIPGYGVAKLNEAYTAGGPERTLATVQNLTKSPQRPNGIEVNHLVNVDFTGFARAVNEIDCVYVDVDRRYFNKNEDFDGQEDYDEIDIQPGYQSLCGLVALDYVRYRHTDNDVVRAARQQDFVREARQKVPPEQLFLQRNRLIDIFVEHTTSDVENVSQLLDVLKLFIEARNAPVKEIHFEGTLGPSFVTATQEQIDTAVDQFLGIQDTPGARGKSATPESAEARAEAERKAKGGRATKKKKKIGSLKDAQLVPTSFGKQLAVEIRRDRPRMELPLYYPTLLEQGSDFPQEPRIYKINGMGRGSPPFGERPAYKWVFSRPVLGEYYGFMGTRWRDPPILENPSEERELGGRTYKLFYDGDRLRLVAWQNGEGSFWLSNTLIQSLSEREMIEIARAMRELPR